MLKESANKASPCSRELWTFYTFTLHTFLWAYLVSLVYQSQL